MHWGPRVRSAHAVEMLSTGTTSSTNPPSSNPQRISLPNKFGVRQTDPNRQILSQMHNQHHFFRCKAQNNTYVADTNEQGRPTAASTRVGVDCTTSPCLTHTLRPTRSLRSRSGNVKYRHDQFHQQLKSSQVWAGVRLWLTNKWPWCILQDSRQGII